MIIVVVVANYYFVCMELEVELADDEYIYYYEWYSQVAS